MANVKARPDGYHTATPYMIITGAARAIEFYKQAFGATEITRMAQPDGTIGHAEIQIGDSRIMLADEAPAMGARSAQTLGGSATGILLYVEDADAFVKHAVDAGARIVRDLENAFYGDRTATVHDPFGNQWFIHTHIEDVPAEQMQERAAAAGRA